MRQAGILYRKVSVYLFFALFLGGCVPVLNTPSPRFYLLRPIDKSEVKEEFILASDAIIAIGPVRIPEYQNRPQIVTKNKDGLLTFAQFDRWSEPLDTGLARLLLENLTLMLPKATLVMFPANFAIPLNYQLIAEVIQLENQLDKGIFFVVQWSIINAQDNKMVFTKRSEFRQPINPHNYPGLVEALSSACASLSSEIAKNIAELVNQPEVKEGIFSKSGL